MWSLKVLLQPEIRNALKNFAMFTAAGRSRNEWEEWEGLDAWTNVLLLCACAQRMGSHANRGKGKNG
jgi:hypothetical protein